MRILCVMLFSFFIFAAAAAASEDRLQDYGAFGQLPVLHEGRIKPLDSFARAELRQIADGETPDGLSTEGWLAETLFDPARAAQRRIFTIRHPAVIGQLGLDVTGRQAFSLEEMAEGLAKTEKLLPPLLRKDADTLTPEEREFVSVHDRAAAYAQLLGSFMMILPLNLKTYDELAPDVRALFGDNPVWLDVRQRQGRIDEALKGLVRSKGEDISRYGDEERAFALAGLELSLMRSAGRKNKLLRVIPPPSADAAEWLSPWQALDSHPDGAAALAPWREMGRAYRAGDGNAWALAVNDMEKVGAGRAARQSLALEYDYNHLRPFLLAQLFYGLALLALVVLGRYPALPFMLALCGAVLQAAGLAARIAVLGRPPVGTLYESLLFVSLVAMFVALVAAWRRKDGIMLGSGLVLAFALLLAAPVFAPQGDSLEMLVAVLNTNFWLATHVICITAGYGVCILAGCVAHVGLWRGAEAGLLKTLHRLLIAGLFLTAFGTMLGGIWADQSWGRFWGWDPKENGALLIVLWVAWVVHGRHGGLLKGPRYLAAVAALNIVVALSWFGVNLLGVGLHSYGFTSGIAPALFVFCAAETVFISFMTWSAGRQEKRI